MEKDQIIILENRGLISITGDDAKEYLQNIVTNDINKVSKTKSIFSALLSPQGKYLSEFFIIKSTNGYYLDCDNKTIEELMSVLVKYKLRSQVEIKDLSNQFVIGIINYDKFKEIQNFEKTKSDTIIYRETPIFVDSRKKQLGARILSNLEKLYLTIKKLNLNIVDIKIYHELAYQQGIPTKGLENLKDQLFGLEANFEELKGIDFKKGCYVGQENTARMKLKNKLRRRLLPIKVEGKINIGSEIMFNNNKIGKVLINDPYPFGLIKLTEPDFSNFKNRHLTINGIKAKLILI
ncbi:MAG: folate-binding protein [Candidatus Pelagibacter sp. TMED263]|nr:MAG: folate-binding protein [Candidatus Pelagibacter sp. TMED263]